MILYYLLEMTIWITLLSVMLCAASFMWLGIGEVVRRLLKRVIYDIIQARVAWQTANSDELIRTVKVYEAKEKVYLDVKRGRLALEEHRHKLLKGGDKNDLVNEDNMQFSIPANTERVIPSRMP